MTVLKASNSNDDKHLISSFKEISLVFLFKGYDDVLVVDKVQIHSNLLHAAVANKYTHFRDQYNVNYFRDPNDYQIFSNARKTSDFVILASVKTRNYFQVYPDISQGLVHFFTSSLSFIGSTFIRNGTLFLLSTKCHSPFTAQIFTIRNGCGTVLVLQLIL